MLKLNNIDHAATLLYWHFTNHCSSQDFLYYIGCALCHVYNLRRL